MLSKKMIGLVSLTALASFTSHSIYATNGYFSHGVGTKNKAQAGAGVATPEEALSLANNPASALLVEESFDMGVALFKPNRSYTSSESLAQGNGGAFTVGPNSLDSGREYFFIPHIAKNWHINDRSAWGIAFYGRGGMNTRWSGGSASFDPDGAGPAPVSSLDGTFGAGRAGVDLAQAFLEASYAYKLSDDWTAGLGLVGVAQSFEATGVGTFAGFTQSFVDNLFVTGQPSTVEGLSNNGHDTSLGLGIKAGLHWQASDSLSFAGAYQPEIGMSEFDDYADLFAQSGGFDIPANAKLGISFNASPKVDLHFDIEKTWYSEVASVGNAFNSLFNCPSVNPQSQSTATCLGGESGAGFGWDDMTTYKLGGSWQVNEDWILRAGFSHGDQPIQESEVLFNILAPGVIEDHLTFGASKQLPSGNEWNVAFLYAPSNSVSGINPFDPSQTIDLEMDQFELEFSYSWK